MDVSPLAAALEQFDAAEANLVKAERLWADMRGRLPDGISFGSDAKFDEMARTFGHLIDGFPMIDGFKPSPTVPSPNDVAQAQFDALEIAEPSAMVWAAEMADEPERELADYRFRLQNKRRSLVREALTALIDQIDADLQVLLGLHPDEEAHLQIPDEELALIRTHVGQVEVLIGSNPRPERWSDLRRHLHFGQRGDLHDIEAFDWPAAKAGLRSGLYGDNEPLPVAVSDLATLVRERPVGPVSVALKWTALDAEGFERLVFALIASTAGYENPQWLMRTNAPDRGRDLSVYRVTKDELAGTSRRRVIIQCKHWLSRSIALDEVTTTKAQVELWDSPKVDVLVMATTGRFTTDCVSWIEQHNEKREAPAIEMWPDSAFENMLSARPDIVATFALR